jgi:hypothetical protein
MQEEIVLREESGEHQAVPLLIRTFGYKQIAILTELAPLGAEAIPQSGLIWVEVSGLVAQEHAKSLKRGAGCSLGGPSRREDGGFELPSESGRECTHVGPQRITVFPASR